MDLVALFASDGLVHLLPAPARRVRVAQRMQRRQLAELAGALPLGAGAREAALRVVPVAERRARGRRCPARARGRSRCVRLASA